MLGDGALGTLLIERGLKPGHCPEALVLEQPEVLAEIGRREGTTGEHEWSFLSNVMGLSSVEVGKVMTPRTDIVAIPIHASVPKAINLMLDEGYLRMPVYGESLDHIVGVLAARDLWRADRSGETEIRSVVRPSPSLRKENLLRSSSLRCGSGVSGW